MKSKKTTTKKTTTKNDVAKNDVKKIIVNNVEMTIEQRRDDLLLQLTKSKLQQNHKLSKSLRHKLRTQCNHYGASRNRTYFDKTTQTRIVIDAKI